MPNFRVIKAHDGIKEGLIKTLPYSTITEYMVTNGYWEEVKDEPKEESKAEPKPETKPKTTKKTARK